MKLIICLAFSTLILTIFEKQFRKRPYILYMGALLIGILGIFYPITLFSISLSTYITRGTLATSLFIIVMYARVLPVKSRFYKTFMSLRAPIAIAASFLIFIHNGKTLYSYIRAYILVGAVLKPHEIFAAVCSAVMFILLIPLTVTSFIPIRKKMKPLHWKKLQQTSYLFYFLTYMHVAFLFCYQIKNGKNSYSIDLAIYTFIFGNYLFLRLALWAKSKKLEVISYKLKLYGVSAVAVTSFALVITGLIPTTIGKEPVALVDSSQVIVLSEGETSDTSVTMYTESTSGTPSGEAMSTDGEYNNDNSFTSSGEKLYTDGEHNNDNSFTSSGEKLYTDGEYVGEAFGYNGNIRVKVLIQNGKISDIKYIEFVDDDEYFFLAWDSILSKLSNEYGVANLDTVSGATYSSKGIINAIEDALEQAK